MFYKFWWVWGLGLWVRSENKGRGVWFWVRARRLGQGGLARSARRARARKSVVGEILERVKKCDGFYNGVAQMASGVGG